MLQFGLHITQPNDSLQKISVERIYQAIRHPKPQLAQQISRLRLVRTMDDRQYSRLKKQLPYFVCGNFHPPIRRKEHFSAIKYFMVDLDHFEEAGKNRLEVMQKLQEDPRVVMLFTSPGGDGLKLMFELQEKCFDSGLYSLFYKSFIQSLAAQHQLEKVIDTATHDVTRACFLSVDERAYLNPIVEPVALEAFFNPTDPDAQHRVEKEHKSLEEKAPDQDKKEERPLSDEVLLEIKKKLNPNFRPKKKRNIYVPPELEDIMPEVEKKLSEVNMSLAGSESINYGKKLKVAAGQHWAEVNVFFGKRGFSVVKTTKSGSNPELADMAHQILYELLINDS